MFDAIFREFEKKKVAVIGDIMLDTYWWGQTDRISPEAPVPVVMVKGKEYRIGGAGNVALNLKSLGAQVFMHAVSGADEDGLLLEIMMKEKGIDTTGIWKSDDRVTTNKIRIVSKSQHLLRLDNEVSTDLAPDKESRFIEKTKSLLTEQQPDVVIFEDYNKGVLTAKVIEALLQFCRQQGIITAVDPKRRHFFNYIGVDIFKPNLKEAKEALHLGDTEVTLQQMQYMHGLLFERLQHRVSLITLSEKGMFYEEAGRAEIVPAHVRNIADVSGAGDTVIAVAALVYAVSKDVNLMANMANLAGGLVCEYIGTVAINADQLLEECNRLLFDNASGTQMADG